MQKRTHDYDNVFKTMKSKHKRLFIPVINDIFKKDYPLDVKVDVLPSEGYLTENETADGSKEIEGNSSAQDFAFTAKSVRTCRFGQKGICPSPQATWNGQIP